MTFIRRYSCILLAVLFFLVQQKLYAQLVVSSALTPAQLVQNMLVGGGVTVSNVSFTGGNMALGSFSNGNTTNLGMNNGVVLSTGSITEIPNPNSYFCNIQLGLPGDADLSALTSNAATFDAAVLQFDFIPLSDTIQFRYVFGSEEYPNYVCSHYYDVMGLFLTGPNPAGGTYNGTNIAIIPGTNIPVGINSVNNGNIGAGSGTASSWCVSLAYSNYYVDNYAQNGQTIAFDGFTTVLTAKAAVTPCQQYHLKIGVCDTYNGKYDSGIFLEANSLSTEDITVSTSYTGSHTSAIEGCSDGIFTFRLPNPPASDVTVNYFIGGNAVNGVDYTNIPGSAVIPAGQDSVSLVIHPLPDGIAEGTETVILTVSISPCATQTDTIYISNYNPLTLSVTPDTTICLGLSTTITAYASGGFLPLTYQWSNGLGSSPSVNINQGVGVYPYTVTVSDACSLTVASGITVTVVDCSCQTPPTNFIVTPPVCYNTQATFVYSGAAPANATYTWDFNGGTLVSGSGQGPVHVTFPSGGTTYHVHLTVKTGGCASSDTTISVTVPVAITGSVTSTAVLCFGAITGTATLAVAGGTSPYSYQWSNNALTQDLAGVAAGTYHVTITDADLCTATSSVTIVQPAVALSAATSGVNVSCYGGVNGTTNVVASGGTSPYTYLWSPGNSASQGLSNLPAGIYCVTVTDAHACTSVSCTTVTQPAAFLDDSISGVDVSCLGGTNGSAHLTVTGGTSPYTYHWSTNSSAQNIAAISAGVYKVTITDVHSCTTVDSVVITQPATGISLSGSSTDVLCFGHATGTAGISVTGAILPVSYAWSNGMASQNIIHLIAGSYHVTVTDAHSCTATSSVTITQPSLALHLVTSPGDSLCSGESETLAATVSGGTSPYNYLWTDLPGVNFGSTDSIHVIPGVPGDTYIISVTDNNGCTVSGNIKVVTGPSFSIDHHADSVKCHGSSTGQIVLAPVGGTPPFHYSWAPPVSSANYLPAGDYSITVTDAFHCVVTVNETVYEPPQLSISFSLHPPACHGYTDGVITATILGGVLPYNYMWSNGVMSDTLVCGAGIYSLAITDAHSCVLNEVVKMTDPGEIKIQTGPVYTCAGNPATLTVYNNGGGTAPLTYYWTLPSGNVVAGSSINYTFPDTNRYYYPVSVYAEDANHCRSNSGVVPVYIYQPVTCSISADKQTICPGDSIMVSASISGGIGPPYYCTLQDGRVVAPPFQLKPEEEDTVITYILTVTDRCPYSASDSLTVAIFPRPDASFTSDTIKGCQPLEVNFRVTDHVNGQKYSWNFHDINGSAVLQVPYPAHTFNEAGIYDVTLMVTSTDGCRDTLNRENMITVYPKPLAAFKTEPTEATILEPYFYFDNNSVPADSCVWDFGDGTGSDEINPQHTYYKVNSYWAKLYDYTREGCLAVDSQLVKVDDQYTFYAPTAFSPLNTDFNNVFFVCGSGIDPQNFHLYIYDRWGEIIFETNQYDPDDPKLHGWDGRVKGMKVAEIGVYTWYVLYRDNAGVEHERVGGVTVIK